MAVEEKRLYPRLVLKIEDGCFGHFKIANEEGLVAQILNLSAGGICVITSRKTAGKIKEGDLLLLTHIAGAASLKFISSVKADVCWIRALDKPEGYVSVGCRFKELSEEVRQQLSRFVNSERIARGQYT